MMIEYKNTRIFAFSDTHLMHWDLFVPDDIDVLICAGDAVEDELDPDNYSDFLNWFESLPAAKRIFVPGNHELIFSLAPKWGELIFHDRNIDLGLDNLIEYNGITFYGLANPEVNGCTAQAADGADFIITHFPPRMIHGIRNLHPHYHLFGHDHSRLDCSGKIPGSKSYNVSKYEELLAEQ